MIQFVISGTAEFVCDVSPLHILLTVLWGLCWLCLQSRQEALPQTVHAGQYYNTLSSVSSRNTTSNSSRWSVLQYFVFSLVTKHYLKQFTLVSIAILCLQSRYEALSQTVHAGQYYNILSSVSSRRTISNSSRWSVLQYFVFSLVKKRYLKEFTLVSITIVCLESRYEALSQTVHAGQYYNTLSSVSSRSTISNSSRWSVLQYFVFSLVKKHYLKQFTLVSITIVCLQSRQEALSQTFHAGQY